MGWRDLLEFSICHRPERRVALGPGEESWMERIAMKKDKPKKRYGKKKKRKQS
jgi:hypothetical protein